MKPGSLSIALCCCNGAAFIDQQLASLAGQSRLPDELVICDDRSDDATPECIDRFARRSPFPVRLVTNPIRLGVAANFDQAISLCQGDFIALCDQDDRWLPDKLQTLHQALSASEQSGLVGSDANLVDGSLHPTGKRLWQILGPDAHQRTLFQTGRGVEVLVHNNVITGATMLFRSHLRRILCPVPKGWMHDAWIALVLTAVSECVLVERPLIDYRQHATQQIGASRHGLWQQIKTARRMEHAYFQDDLVRWESAVSRLEQFRECLRQPEDLALVRQRAEHARRRLRMRQSGQQRRRLAWSELRSGDYARFALGWKSFLQDVFLKSE